ncbi:carbohydrate kinase family protein [uncultured Traorella sp.]|uniref:carbohydrate kinase family protein n=1 Tax=uncultured Traorella sp. TaxID=1929048 RepID=UPI0025EE6A84|nr:carbohydrate kinase family protein [uncultured Traorella sp.]
MKPEIIIIGAAILDVLAYPTDEHVFQEGSYPCEDIELSYGGDALNEALVLSAFHKKVELMTILGKDQAGEFIVKKCRQQQILLNEKTMRDDLKTGINTVLIKKDGSRHFLTNANGSLRKLTLEDIPLPFVTSAKIVCFASIFVFPQIRDHELMVLFKTAKKQGMIVAADMTKCKHQETLDDLKLSLPYVDYLFCNDAEAQLVTRADSVEASAEQLYHAGAKNVIIKIGAKGCYVHNDTLHCWVSPKKEVVCVDTTGAGDSFVAGFFKALLEKQSLMDCLDFGNECGGKATTQIGATRWLENIQ